jgi:pilus assembly protein Flp/PilA
MFQSFGARLHREDRGATMVEYGLLLALIAIAVIVAVTAVGTNLYGVFDESATELDVVTP